ncbi:hypothetical protein Goari_006549 [Gossypium aridum]|uniref:Uncharacterized protein n=1 Tax=Gossypium aridum TaxID=34290 RepID=A0A7J8XNJ4_GOSAI|nr:hypothetical protein [Gossypium aridum]
MKYLFVGNCSISLGPIIYALEAVYLLENFKISCFVFVQTLLCQQFSGVLSFQISFRLIKVKGCGEASCDSLFSAPIQGYMLGILSACLSALAGVYTEFLMKKNNDSLYWQNIQLYTFGSIFNMARLVVDDFRGGFEKGPWWQRLFNGYSITTWLVVLNLGSTGLLVSWLMKYADNIVKVPSLWLDSACGIFHIDGHAIDNGSVCVPLQFQANTSGRLHCCGLSKISSL